MGHRQCGAFLTCIEIGHLELACAQQQLWLVADSVPFRCAVCIPLRSFAVSFLQVSSLGNTISVKPGPGLCCHCVSEVVLDFCFVAVVSGNLISTSLITKALPAHTCKISYLSIFGIFGIRCQLRVRFPVCYFQR